MNTLPKNGYEYSSDSKVDLIEFCPQFNVIPTSPSDSIPMGHLVHPSDKNVSALIEIIATKREKDSLSDLCKKLMELLTKAKLKFNLPRVQFFLFNFSQSSTIPRALLQANNF